VTRLSITHEQCVKDRVKDHAARLTRVCKCGAPIPYDAHANRRSCDYCYSTASSRHARVAREAGKCHWCLKRDASNGRFCSIACKEASNASATKATSKRRKRLIEAGMCTQCGKVTAENGRQRCAPCHARTCPKSVPRPKSLFVCACGKQEWTHMAATKKRCNGCTKKLAKERSIETRRELEDAAIEQGNCATCLKRPTSGTRECEVCATRRKLRRLERAERGKA
jgi:hypothetical protein